MKVIFLLICLVSWFSGICQFRTPKGTSLPVVVFQSKDFHSTWVRVQWVDENRVKTKADTPYKSVKFTLDSVFIIEGNAKIVGSWNLSGRRFNIKTADAEFYFMLCGDASDMKEICLQDSVSKRCEWFERSMPLCPPPFAAKE